MRMKHFMKDSDFAKCIGGRPNKLCISILGNKEYKRFIQATLDMLKSVEMQAKGRNE
jgi:hypothetical protein